MGGERDRGGGGGGGGVGVMGLRVTRVMARACYNYFINPLLSCACHDFRLFSEATGATKDNFCGSV